MINWDCSLKWSTACEFSFVHTKRVTGFILPGADVQSSEENSMVMAFTALPQETRLPLAKAVERLVSMMADGQAQLPTTDRHRGVRAITFINQRLLISATFSTDRVFFQQQQADHHNVDVCPDGSILEQTGNLQEEKRLVKQQFSPAVAQVRDSEILRAPKKSVDLWWSTAKS